MTEYRFGDICKVINGRAYRQPELLDTGKYPVLRVGNFFSSDRWFYSDLELPEDKYCNNGDLLFAWSASFGPRIWDGGKVIYHYHIWKLEPNEAIVDKYYLYYWLRKSVGILTAGTHGSVMAHMTKGDMENQRILLPQIEEQRKVGKTLRLLDDKIKINSKINDNLQQQAVALYKSWFVDFSSAPNYEMVDSEIGKIPYGWRVYRLAEFLPVITGKKNANVSSEKGDYPFFSCSQGFAWTDDYSFEGHAILVAGNGDFNVKWYKGKFEAYQRTYVLIPYEERNTSWLYYAVKYNLTKITSAARGSVIKFITKGNLENFAFAAPSDLSSCEIIDTFAAINRKIDCLTQENYRLAVIRNALLPKLMCGEIDVSDIDA